MPNESFELEICFCAWLFGFDGFQLTAHGQKVHSAVEKKDLVRKKAFLCLGTNDLNK